MFLSGPNKVVIIDKTEGNGNNLNINGCEDLRREPADFDRHPAWTVEYNTDTNTVRALDVRQLVCERRRRAHELLMQLCACRREDS